jgi:hypothetical protein
LFRFGLTGVGESVLNSPHYPIDSLTQL